MARAARLFPGRAGGRAGLHRTYLSDIERGARNISLESIEKLALALELPAATLFTPEGNARIGRNGAHRLSADDLVHILLVEDNPDDVRLTLRALEAANITNRIHVVNDGAAALDFLFCTGDYAHRDPSDPPQLILLDLGLPTITGMDVLRRLKANSKTRSIPVAVLTGSRQDRDIAASRRLGAEAYIVKPVDFQNLSEVTPRMSFHWALLKTASI